MTKGIAPDPDNATLFAGVKIFFTETGGAGELDLGIIDSLDINHVIESLKLWSNRGGQREVVKEVPTTRELDFPIELMEFTADHLRMYFAGGQITSAGGGSASKTDQKLILTGANPVSLGPYYGLSAVTVRQFLDKVFRYDGEAFIDNSAEADTTGGTPFAGISATDEYLFLGKATKFNQVYFDLAVNGDYGDGLTWKYWNGSEWAAIVGGAGAGLDMEADGVFSHTPQSDWAKTTVNGQNLYWLRASAGTVTTPATVNCIRQNGVAGTDYVVIPGQSAAPRSQGAIMRVAGGMFEDGEEVKVSFTYETWSGLSMPLSGSSYLEGSARIEIFPNPELGMRLEFIHSKVQVRPNGNITGNDQDWTRLPLLLKFLYDENNPDAPRGRLIVYDS